MAIHKALKSGEAGPDFSFAGKPCGLCGDPERAPGEWHSEDYSPPFLFEPPATYAVCKPCHGRLHKRFNRPASEWELFCRHVEAGGYGREFTTVYPVALRSRISAAIERGEPVEISQIRHRAKVERWWRNLTLDPEALLAPWARPRPWRPRPEIEAYRSAFADAKLSASDWAILRYHAQTPHRTVTMRMVAREALCSEKPNVANLAYGRIARRIGERLDWEPDRRPDDSRFWLSVLAEGWQPPSSKARPREYELVMVRTVADLIDSWPFD